VAKLRKSNLVLFDDFNVMKNNTNDNTVSRKFVDKAGTHSLEKQFQYGRLSFADYDDDAANFF
jgi:hypothetical protein